LFSDYLWHNASEKKNLLVSTVDRNEYDLIRNLCAAAKDVYLPVNESYGRHAEAALRMGIPPDRL
jgi:hypothetical protein